MTPVVIFVVLFFQIFYTATTNRLLSDTDRRYMSGVSNTQDMC